MNIIKVAILTVLAAFTAGEVYASPVAVCSGREEVPSKAVEPENDFALEGRWSGKVDLGTAELEIVFNIERKYNYYKATMDVPAQGVKGLYVDLITFEDGRLNIQVQRLRFEYAGFLNDAGEFKGNMFQNGYNLILDLSRSTESDRKRVQNVEDKGHYITWDVLYKNEADRNTLGATVVMPENFDEDTPVVVLVSGSGQQDRDGEVMGHKILKVLADFLVQKGIGSLRYDDRGTGQSDTVGLRRATSIDFMRDALSGVKFLKEEKGFRHVGMLGHSEGGMISFMASSRSSDLDFIVSLSGPAMRGDSVLIYQNKALLRDQGVPRKEIRKYCNMLRDIFEIKANNDPDNVISRHDAFAKELENRYNDLTQGLKDNISPLLIPSVWLDFYLTYSPSNDLKNLNCPLLSIQGGRDMQVPARQNVKALRNYTYNQREVSIRKYRRLNHLLQHCRTGNPMEYYGIEETISEEVMEDIASWILRTLKQRNR